MSPSPRDLAALDDAIAGEVVTPESERYELVCTPPVARFEGIRPDAVVICTTTGDIKQALSLVRRSGAGVAIRSGGHCFAGRSSTEGVLIDVGPMNAVSVTDGIARVGAGTRLGELYDALAAHGLAVAGGCGPSVGIAGLALGGGLGILGRRYGLTCDQLVGAEVVLADGRVVECDADHDPDLLWALRGAGGGQLGVVTTLMLRTVAAPSVTTFDLTWPIAEARALIAAWQTWAPAAPDELAASLLAVGPADPADPPSVHVFGAMLGTRTQASGSLDTLAAAVRVDPTSARLVQAPFREAKHDLAEHGPADSPAESSPEHDFSRSEFFRAALPADAVAALIDNFALGRREGQRRTLDFTPWGGAYNRVAPDATAFVHRAERYLLKHDVAVCADASHAERHEARAWLGRSWSLVHPFGSGGVYPNFPDPELNDPARAYYGTNLRRLTHIKAAYDPENLFRFDQSVAPTR
jgi:FAD/FMN-containing dehydrogenase